MSKSNGMTRALNDALRAAQIQPCDAGTVHLAKRYAHIIDGAGDYENEWEILDDLGPKLLACLDALGMTPKARAASKRGGEGGGSTGSPVVDELRARREQRQGQRDA